jgi:hypothetical protein
MIFFNLLIYVIQELQLQYCQYEFQTGYVEGLA